MFWVEWLVSNTGALEDFTAFCDSQIKARVALVEEIVCEDGNLTKAAAALGEKRGIEFMREKVASFLREETAREAHLKRS